MKSLCPTGKELYGSREAAEATIKRMLRDGADPTALKSYRCWECGYLHIGHSQFAMREAERKTANDERKALLHKLKHMSKEWDRHDTRVQRRRATALQILVDADRALWQAEENVRNAEKLVMKALGA